MVRPGTTHQAASGVRSRPILFSAPMVRALLAGTKTQTRRIVKPRGSCSLFGVEPDGAPMWTDSYILDPGNDEWRLRDCPYGVPGDVLWVREAWRTELRNDHIRPRDLGQRNPIYYDAGGGGEETMPSCAGRGRPSIHMPRWVSRISLRITDVRVERLKQISHRDACAEGLISKPHHWHDPEGPLNDVGYLPWDGASDVYSDATDAYRALWEHINGPGSWAANPWVWAVSFEVMSGHADADTSERSVQTREDQ